METLSVARKGRGTLSNDASRFDVERRLPFDDGWGTADEEPVPLQTILARDATRTIISTSPVPAG